MKKSTMRALALVMAIMMIVGTLAAIPFSALPAEPKCVHTKGTLVETVEPTCQLYGYSVYKCAECGEAFITDVTDKTEAHDWQEIGEVPATCDTPGSTAGRKCTICGAVEGCAPINVEHVRAYKIYDVDDCEEGVWYVEYCKVCGEILGKVDHALVDEQGHVLKADVKVAPTCAAEGLADVYCEECGYIVEDVVVAKLEGDDVHDWEEKTIPATFAENEKTYKECKVCGEKTEEVEKPNTSIAFKRGINIAADYALLGYGESKTYNETYNGVTYTYTITKDACEHNFVAAGYAFDVKEGNVTTTYKSTDYDYADVFIRDYAQYLDIADLYELEICSICGEAKKTVLINKVGHIYDEYTFEFYHKVLVAGGEDIADFAPYNLVEPEGPIVFPAGYDRIIYVCNDGNEENGEEKIVRESLCTFCQARQEEPTRVDLGDAPAHEYVYVCTECKDGKAVYEEKEGEQVVSAYYECTNCEHIRAKVCLNPKTESPMGLCFELEPGTTWAAGEHTRGEEEYTMPATCVDLAYKYNKCTVCGAEMKIEDSEFGEVDPTNHDWEINEKNKIITLTSPTCVTAGERIRYCNRFGCTEYITEPIEALGDEFHTMDKYNEDGTGILRKKDEIGFDVQAATCTTPRAYKLYCTICAKIVYVYEGEVDPENHGYYNTKGVFVEDFETVEATGLTCTADGNYEYTYCKQCGAVTVLDGDELDEGELNINDEDFLDAISEINENNRYLPEDWDYVYGGDTEIEYEVIYFANGEPMFYRILSGGIGHAMCLEEGYAPNCYETGKKDKFNCSNCDYVAAGKDGAEIPALNHKNAKTQALKAGDEAEEITVTIAYEQNKFLWANLSLRAKTIKRYMDEGALKGDFTIEYVEATCEKEGYIVGAYCPDCMEKDNDGEPITIFNPDNNVAGYVLEAKGHDYQGDDENDPDEICGTEFYSCKIKKCTRCGEYIVKDFEPAEYDEHKAEVYAEDQYNEDEELVAKKGDVKIYTLVRVGEDYVEIGDNFLECTETKYEAKKCVNCGEYFDIVEIAPKGHYTQDGVKIDITCTGYNAEQVGLVCACCGLEVPEYKVEKDERGLDVQVYYTAEGAKLDAAPGQYGYFAIEHEWAIPQDDCEALNAEILACAACGINVINEDADDEANVHEYYLRNKEGEDYEFGKAAFIAPFDIDEYDEFAFDDVTYPTPTAEGFGKLSCAKCGKVLEVVLPVLAAEAKASFDSAETVLVGDEVTVTVTVSAKEYAFNELTLYVTNIQNVFELVGAEVVYPFAAIDDVKAYINADGDVIIRTPGVANRNVTVTGENVPFVKLTFKTGDLTNDDEYTVLNNLKILGSDVVRIDDDGEEVEVPENEQFNVVEGGFGTLTIYNPAFTGNAIGVLAQIYSTEYNQKFDFNRDGAVDLDDYFAMVDFIDSEKSIADFCTLIGYDIEAMLDTLDYATYSSGKAWTLNPNTGVAEATQGTDADIANAKEVIKRELKATSYYEIAGYQTIAQFAQDVID